MTIDNHGHEEWIRADAIAFTPDAWGRPLRGADVRLIAAEFDPDKFGRIFVWRRPDGTDVTIDGQHRLAAVRNGLDWGDQQVPCIVYDHLTEREAADLSLGLQERRNLHAVDRHRAAIMAGHKRAQGIQNALDAVGVELTKSHNRQYQVTSIDAIGHAWDRLGESGVIRLFRILLNTWDGREGSLTSKTIALVGLMLTAYPKLDDNRLCVTLGRFAASDWVASTNSAPGRSVAHVAVDVIGAYNKRLGADNKLPEMLPHQLTVAYRRSSVPHPMRGTKIPNGKGRGGTSTSRRRK